MFKYSVLLAATTFGYFVHGHVRPKFIALLVFAILACLLLPGCTAQYDGHTLFLSYGLLTGMFFGFAGAFWMADHRRPFWILAIIGTALVISGCAALPMPLQPAQQTVSNYAEGGFLVLDGIDTMQTIQIAKHHNCLREGDPVAAWFYGSKYPSEGRVIVTNLGIAVVHTVVTSWLDDHAGDNGFWRDTRIAWGVVSLAYSGGAVVNNYSKGISPTGVTNKDCA